ncbi:hypothetical protein EJ03DRAFT_171110 [Teratosphaeria nubilosa]|uniref:SMODS and SLOG-associating 2TM effector domain-containing protein n=1 Tax=Teratosphaeria nubilosa TaxID=161662 RepID=A0A6G1LJQ7_9PEZI|nr:hypothetical protein EJ03DRAFT_171110 [Teratosphaeria nubilosa]
MSDETVKIDDEKERPRPDTRRLRMDTNVLPLSTDLDPQFIEARALHRAETFHRLMGMAVWSDPGDHMTVISALNPMPRTPDKLRRVSTDIEAQRKCPRTRSYRRSWLDLLGLSVLDKKRESSLYWTIVKDENRSRRLYNITLWYVYLFYLAQLTIAAVLIILGALPDDHHISIAVLGAVTGVITGLLSLIQR